ncbi:MAG TPA: hypothetical protein VFF65_12535, partial [Phycisphaerales bacterium]|nr:hypothetical protein [Phycisphaerales bacterium]
MGTPDAGPAAPPANPRLPLRCVHCTYELRDTAPDGTCPECGNPVADTRNGSLFYRLPPTRLGSISVGLWLTAFAGIGTFIYAASYAAWMIAGGVLPDWATPLWGLLEPLQSLLYAPWIAVFILCAPLNRHSGWLNFHRAALIALAASTVVATMLSVAEQQTTLTTGVSSPLANACTVYLAVTGIVPHLFAAVRLHQIAQRLPSMPFRWLAPLSIVCGVLLLV